MARKFRELIAKKPPEWHAMVAARKRELLAEMLLQELRRARQLSQEALAGALGASQLRSRRSSIGTDLYVSTLRRYVEAMGGELEIAARFPGGTVRIIQFRDLELMPRG